MCHRDIQATPSRESYIHRNLGGTIIINDDKDLTINKLLATQDYLRNTDHGAVLHIGASSHPSWPCGIVFTMYYRGAPDITSRYTCYPITLFTKDTGQAEDILNQLRSGL